MSTKRLHQIFPFGSTVPALKPSGDSISDHIAGLAAGITEAVTVVTTMEVLKVRLQGQKSSNREAGNTPKYRNAAHAAYIIAKDEGPKALFKGMSLTALRQATNVSGKIDLLYVKKGQPSDTSCSEFDDLHKAKAKVT